jgi:hypothetical protein
MLTRCSMSLLLSLGLLLLPVAARPQVPEPSPAPAAAGPGPGTLAARLSALEAENAALQTALAQLEDSRARLAALERRLAALQAQAAGPAAGTPAAAAALEERLSRLEAENGALREALSKPAPRPSAPSSLSLFGGARVRVVGYLDAGFFDAGGDGTAYVRDVGKVLHPEFADVPWVFVGDPWANPINSQGDSADLGLDRTNLQRFDPIRSGGHSSFLVNTANLGLVGSVKDGLLFETSIGFEPRSGQLGSSGDQIDVDLAYLEWIPLKKRDLHVFVGKFESTFGIEYPHRKAPDRFGITPSLIHRYTAGNPTGLKVRAATRGGRWTFNLALTNGTMTTEKFAQFFDELDTNSGKTVSGRVSFKLPLPFTLELGASGVYGAQDLRSDNVDPYRQFGFDALLRTGDLTVRAEWLKAEANRHRVPDVAWLHAKGGYAEASYQALVWVGAFLRADFRDALLRADTNLYITDTVRGTAGLRFDVSPNLIGKVEYLRVKERRGPDLDDDVFTSSLIFRF